MTVFQQIRDIPILGVLHHLGLQTQNGKILHNGKQTDGWTVNVNENFVKDFSQERGQGDQLAFVQSYLGITKKEAIEWFKESII